MNPTTFTQAKADEICRRLAQGEPLAQICRDAHMPAKRTVSDWRKAHPAFDADFLQARDDGFDAIAADCLHIADTPMEGIVEKLELVEIENPDDPDGPRVKELQVTERRREDMLGHRKLQIETRLKLLSKWDPRRYGDRLALANDHEDPITGLTDEQVADRLRKLMGRASGEGEGNGRDAE